MRISTASAFDTTVDSLQRRQSELSEAQQRLTSGKRVLRASDDPVAAARAERALSTETLADNRQRALQASRNAMSLAEGSLGDASDLLQQIREALVAGGNASYTDKERQGLADKIAGLRAQLLVVANRSDGAGTYLFAGQGGAQAPFLDTTAGVQFRGVSGQIATATPETLPLAVDGAGAWLSARSGNGVFETRPADTNTGSAYVDAGRVTDPSAITGANYSVQFSVSGGATSYTVLKDGVAVGAPQAYSSGTAIEVDGMSFTVSGTPADGDRFDSVPSTPSLSIFDTLDRVVAELRTPMRNAGEITQGISRGIRDVDQSMSALGALRSQLGEMLNLTDGAESRNADLKLNAQTERSNAEDLDMVQAISDFQNQQSGYDAALKTYSMVQRMSLFQYLNS
jgi:flagellar hook-associated protein 3 FlgL